MFRCQNPDHKSSSYEIVEYKSRAVVFCYHDCWIADIPTAEERERLAKIAATQEAQRRMRQCQEHHDVLRAEMGDEHYEKIFG